MRRARNSLTEAQKIEILKAYDRYGPKWVVIGRILNINPCTIKSFYRSYTKHGTISPKIGRPVQIEQTTKDGIIGALECDPECSLRELNSLFDVSITSIRKILNEDRLQYYRKIAVPDLTDDHKIKRLNFANNFTHLTYRQMPIIIFTDESCVEVNLRGGIWRRRGEYPIEAFYEKNTHPIKCMVWGGIGPRGFRTTLIKIEGKINAESYVNMLQNNNIQQQIINCFGHDFIYQHDNARPHTARAATEYLDIYFPNRLQWPPKSPDLSPIEQIWDYLKRKIRGIRFTNAIELFNRLQIEWDLISDEVIHNCHSSFLARCRVCAEINGANLNGHWNKVKRIHDSYRTKIHYFYDNNFNLFPVDF